MKKYVGIAMLVALWPGKAVFAQSAELNQYVAIRDSFERRIPPWPSNAKIDWDALYVLDSAVRRRLAPLARAIVGPFDMPGLAQPGIFNVDTFLPGSEDSFLADGIRYTSADGKTTVFVSTPDLVRVWRKGDPIRTLSSLDRLNGIFPADAGITPYAVIPIAKPKGVLIAILMARQQDTAPFDPDVILLSLVRGAQLVVVEAPAPAVIAVPACKGPHWLQPLEALRPPPTVAESLFKYPFAEDAGYRACYARGLVKDPRWPQIVAKAEQLAVSILGR
jgi:hypothetical protein